MEHYSAMRKDETLLFATMLLALEIVMLSEMSQMRKVKNHMISLVCGM